MILSHRKRFVMLLPWKAASQTLVARLARLDESPYSRFFALNPHLNRVVHQHLTASDFLGLPESRLGYRVAVFVRNPYDRCYSGFRQLQGDLRDHPKAVYPAPWVRQLVGHQLAYNRSRLEAAGRDFDRWIHLLEEHEVRAPGHNTSLPLHPVHYWTHAGGRPVADFIGRTEAFEEDFARFARAFDLGPLPALDANVGESAPPGPHGYRYVGRMKPATVRKINRLFAEDFDRFNYPRL